MGGLQREVGKWILESMANKSRSHQNQFFKYSNLGWLKPVYVFGILIEFPTLYYNTKKSYE